MSGLVLLPNVFLLVKDTLPPVHTALPPSFPPSPPSLPTLAPKVDGNFSPNTSWSISSVTSGAKSPTKMEYSGAASRRFPPAPQLSRKRKGVPATREGEREGG
jgi:hypothetical protein